MARQLEADIFNLCIILLFVILNSKKPPKTKSVHHPSVQEIDFEITTACPPDLPLKSCKVVLEDIYPKSVAEKLHALNSPQDKPHKRNSRHTEVGKYLQDLQAKPPIAWGKMDDVKWSTLDNAVCSKLHKCNSLSERVKLLKDTIHEEGLKIFGHAPAKELRNLSGKNRRTLRSI